MKNYFFDLPKEIIIKIYLFDNTYKKIYDENIKIIKLFPKFNYRKNNINYFTKNFKYNNTEQNFYVKTIYYKKSLILGINSFSKSKIFIY